MGLNRASHSGYDTKFYIVWAPKYRKWILRGEIRERIKRLFKEILKNNGIKITVDHCIYSFIPAEV